MSRRRWRSELSVSLILGDLVTITGVVKLINSDQSKKARDKSLFMVYVNANHVVNHKAKMHKVGIQWLTKGI